MVSSVCTRRLVIVVDDDAQIRSITSRILQDIGFDGLEAADGRLGIELLRANARRTQAVLVDYSMPGIGARETLDEMRRISSTVKLVIASGWEPEDIPDSADFCFLQKPYRPAELLEAIG